MGERIPNEVLQRHYATHKDAFNEISFSSFVERTFDLLCKYDEIVDRVERSPSHATEDQFEDASTTSVTVIYR
jgi:hypothetical protein